MENRDARRESVAGTRPYNEILIPPFDFDFLEKRSMEIKLLATTVRRHNKSTESAYTDDDCSNEMPIIMIRECARSSVLDFRWWTRL